MNPTPALFGLTHAPGNVPPQMYANYRLPAAAQGGRRHRRNTSSSVQSDSSYDPFDGDAVDEESPDEDNDWLWRAKCAGSSSDSSNDGYCNAYHPRPQADGASYGTPVSPSPARAQLQRAAKSSSSVPRRHSHSQSMSSRAPLDQEVYAATPHEAVLKSRLEGVLKNAKAHDRRPRSVERRDPDSGFSSGSGNSTMASSRNMSGEGDFFFGAGGDVST